MTGFSNPIIGGGGALVYPAIKSPNFVTGVSGWRIAKNGSAEFSNVIIRNGQIISGSSLYYSGAPALGNLVASVSAAAGTDIYGNAYLSGITSYFGNTAQQNNSGLLTWYTAPTSAGPWTIANQVQLDGLGTAESLRVNGAFSVERALILIPPSGDTTGATDTAVISAALAAGSVQLTPGTFYLNSQVTVAGTTLAGSGFATVIRPNTTGGAYAGALLAAGAKSWITGLTVSNSGSDAITVAGGIAEWWLTDLNFASNAGWCINATITGPAHGRIRGPRGQGGSAGNGGGLALNGGTGGAVTAEVNLSDIDIQNCTATEVIFCSAVTDVLCPGPVNGSIKSGVAANGITIQGACQTVHLLGLDVGGGTGTGVCVVKAAGGSSPSDIRIGGKLQSGQVGLVVNDGVAGSRFEVDCTRNQGDGAQFNGTGGANKLLLMANLNNQAAGTAYDCNVTSSAHLYIDSPQYRTPGGGAVTANLNITIAGNHVTHKDPPAGTTTAGNAPAGW